MSKIDLGFIQGRLTSTPSKNTAILPQKIGEKNLV